jgi:serine/threonine protein kinase
MTANSAGTVTWTSPQRLGELPHRCIAEDDVYSFGCLIYYVRCLLFPLQR